MHPGRPCETDRVPAIVTQSVYSLYRTRALSAQTSHQHMPGYGKRRTLKSEIERDRGRNYREIDSMSEWDRHTHRLSERGRQSKRETC